HGCWCDDATPLRCTSPSLLRSYPMQMSRSTPAEARFLAKIDKTDGCWLWRGERPRGLYGRFKSGGRRVSAHRWAYEHWRGPIPEGLLIDHLCRNPGCVTPAHLEPVTQRTNLLRGDTFQARNVAKTHCPQGHPYDEANTYPVPQGGGRGCLTCRRIRSR